MNSDSIIAQVQHYAREALGLTLQDRILAAVSGGPDSVALLHILRGAGYALGIGHFDHRTRAGASGEDADFVRELGRSLNVQVYEGASDVAAESAERAESFEMHARQVRYAFLVGTARAHGYSCVATGHHADDQAETVLMRLIRGTSPQGLTGIPPMRIEEGVRIVRPLLACRREDLRAFLHERRLPFRTDVSNEDVEFTRNRVRHTLIPLLREQFNPQVSGALNRLAEIQRVDQGFLDDAAREAAQQVVIGGAINRASFAALHAALQRRVVQQFAWRLGVACDYERLVSVAADIAAGRTGKVLELGGGIRLRNGAMVTEVEMNEGDDAQMRIPLAVPGTTLAFTRRFTTRLLAERPAAPLKEYCTPARQVFNAEAITGNLYVRRRMPGDRLTPFGMSGTRKLKDYLIDLKLTASERAAQLLLVADGEIAWVVGRAIGARFAVDDSTRQFLEVEVADADS